MDFIYKCPECKKHGILKTLKRIQHSSTARLPQRKINCDKCHKSVRATIIGEVIKQQIPQENVNPEIAQEIQPQDRLVFRFWRKP
jgi:hypothetical protein